MSGDSPTQPELETSSAAVSATEAIAQLARDLHRESAAADVLDRVVELITDVLPEIDHAAITLVQRHRRFVTAASTGPLPRQVDEIQYDTGQGPCLDVLRRERTYHARDLTHESRWPDFTRRTVVETAVRSMLCFQLLADADTLGALNLYSTTIGAFDDERLRALCAVFATHAALALARAREHDQFLGMQAGRDAAGEINVAVGITMARQHLTRPEAFEVLRQRARTERRSLDEVSRAVIETP